MRRNSGPPPGANPANSANPRAAAFHQAVATAEVAIRRRLALRQVFPGLSRESPQAVAARLRELAAAGETPTPEQLAALAEALEGAANPRGRGRPRTDLSIGSPEWAAAVAGLDSLGTSPLPLYANPFGPGLSRCLAVAEAMRRCGLRKGATPAAVAKVARIRGQLLRQIEIVRGMIADCRAQFAALAEARDMGRAIPPDELAAAFKTVRRATGFINTLTDVAEATGIRRAMPPGVIDDFSGKARQVTGFLNTLADLAEIFPPDQRRGRSCTGESE
jgi:hypothetical protein